MLDFVKRIKCWWKDFAKTQSEGTVPEGINRNAKLPPLPVFLTFVQHQALSTHGRITEYAVKDTIKSQFNSLFAIWQREALQPLSAVYRQQIFAYIDSEELQAIAPLCTDARPKFTLTAVDFEILVRAFFLDTGFRTVHMSIQMAYIISIQSLMTERPGDTPSTHSHLDFAIW
ncbi:uncharacterized protein ARMOST_17394 [Armillaria ostoyae]|uniref:Uncharacterized protein n=1 Tax=Armillaria ostoyae TaxID=47428 RepID=A0A284RYU4_ARMOS|nr:uncharacterized protein ARMOST_17394 [Armillaria ostoyae]